MSQNSEYENKKDKSESESAIRLGGILLGFVIFIILVVIFGNSLGWIPWWGTVLLTFVIPIFTGESLVRWNRKLANKRGTEF